MPRVALYPGTFDPITSGHIDILSGAFALADDVVVAIGIHPSKETMFTLDERKAMIETAVAGMPGGVAARTRVIAFDGLTVDAARSSGAQILVRGLRNAADFDYEMQMAATNAVLAPEVQTVFLPGSNATRHITATLVRQIARMGGDVSAFVPAGIVAAIAARTGRRDA